MTVVKFSILTLLAGGFCTLLGIGMWMGPQETACNAQTGATVAVVDSPAACKSCWSAPAHAEFGVEFVSSAAECSGSACDSAACGTHESAASVAPLTASAAPQPVVPRIPAAAVGAYIPGGPCDSGVCVPPGVPFPPASAFATTSIYHVAPCAGPECPPPAYANPYAVAPAYVAPAPVVSTYASYREVEPRTSDEPSMEMIEAFIEEREKRYEAQIEALEAQMELKLEAQEAILKAQHQIEMAKLHSEAFVKLAGMEQALREEKALLQLVAEGTLTNDALRTIIAKNHANGHGSPVQPVSTAAGCACEKCECETCKCGQPGASCACDACECEGCACPGCEQAVSTAAPACSASKASACETSSCQTKACQAAACTASPCKNGECKSCNATAVLSAGTCKGCEACAKACGDCKVADATLECDALTVSADGKTCTIVVGTKLPTCPNGECKASGCTTEACKGEACKGAACKTGECDECDKSVAVETTESPFVCEKDGCELNVHVTEVPVLSEIPYVGRLFRNVGIEVEESDSAEQAQR